MAACLCPHLRNRMWQALTLFYTVPGDLVKQNLEIRLPSESINQKRSWLNGGEEHGFKFQTLSRIHWVTCISSQCLSFLVCKINTKVVSASWVCYKNCKSPGWCGLVGWVLACEPKGHQFDSQSGYMPGLRATFSVGGVWEATNWCIFHISMISPSFPSLLSKNK